MAVKFGLGPVRTLAAAVAVVALVGCGGSDETATEKATPAATRAQSEEVPDQLVGIWTRILPGRTPRGRSCGPRRPGAVKPEPTDTSQCTSESKWVAAGVVSLKVGRDGNAEIYQAATDPASDCLTEYFCSAMVITPRNGNLILGEAGPCNGPATYSYKITAGKLKMKAVKEGCDELRPYLFDGATWRRKL